MCVHRGVRLLLALLLLPALARADLTSEAAKAFRADEPAERVARLELARTKVGDADERLRNKAAREIEKALKKEPHPDVRNAAYDFLLALRTERALDRLVAGVLDRDERVYVHVHEIVRDHADPALFAAIVRALEQDESWRFRAAMVDLVVSGARERGKPVLLRALQDKHPAVAARAAEGLERLTGEPGGLDVGRWKAYFARVAKEKPKQYKETGETVTVADSHRKVERYDGPIRGLVPRLYGVPISRKRVIFVVDMSSSMKKGSRSGHFTELKEAIYGLPSDCFFNVLCFDQRLFFFTSAKGLVPATTRQKSELKQWIDGLPAGEKTDVNKSVVTGLAMLKESLAEDETGKAELFILTDGRETAQSTSLRMVQTQFERLPKDRCAVHVVALGSAGTPTLKALVQASGGQFVETGR